MEMLQVDKDDMNTFIHIDQLNELEMVMGILLHENKISSSCLKWKLEYPLMDITITNLTE